METEVTVNLTVVGPDTIHPCFEVDHFYQTVKNTRSLMCVLLCSFLALMSVITICGNLLVIISIIYFRQLHTPTNYLIVSLAVADLFVGSILCPASIAYPQIRCTYLNYDYDGNYNTNNTNSYDNYYYNYYYTYYSKYYFYYQTVFCTLNTECDLLLTTCSVLNLGCISIDRYYAVCHPLTYRTKMSDHVVAIMILVSWGYPTATVFGDLVYSKYINLPCNGVCPILVNAAMSLASFLPSIIMICMSCIYLKIFIVAQRQVRSIQNTTCQSTKSGATVSKMERKATKTLAIVLGVYIACCFSYSVAFMANFNQINDFDSDFIPVHVKDTLVWIKLSNSMLNPFIYAFFYSWFRSAFRMIIFGKIFQGDFTNSQLH